MRDRPDGLYEAVIDGALARALDEAVAAGRHVERGGIEPGEAHLVLGGALGRVLERALRAVSGDGAERLRRQVSVCNQVLDVVRGAVGHAGLSGDDHLQPEMLLGLLSPATPFPGAPDGAIRPGIPLSQSALLVNARGEHRIGHELQRELESADAADLLCSFIKWSGFVRLRDAIARHCRERGRPLRVLTTVYLGATDRRALDELVALGADVRVSYDARRTRLHAKAWLFHRQSGFDTAYVGSSNVSHAALTDGMEWNVRVSAVDAGRVLDKFRATFDTYWDDSEFRPYDPAEFTEAVRRERPDDDGRETLSGLEVRPHEFQREILDRLHAERTLHGRCRNLVVAATGTGKTVIAALDYKRLVDEHGPLRLLFVAHREEILKQSRSVFRNVLGDGGFGELLVGGARPQGDAHLFASIQSLARVDLSQVRPDAWDMVIVDEVHHAAAATYEALLGHVAPRFLLGLTATPERADGRDILGWFDRVAAELRVWDAVEKGHLSPFQYFVIPDDTDLSAVRWRAGGYVTEDLDNVYTGDDARVRAVLRALRERVADPRGMRAIGFCVSIRHAEFMARRFSETGVPALALTSGTPRDERADAVRRLRAREVNVLFTVDLFNEGVDIPDVDTVLFLRPTESATVFLQQLGRGLRLAKDKECLTVLDFVGRANGRFRWDLRFRALTGGTRREVERQVEDGFPLLPPGCAIELHPVARRHILDNIRQSVIRGTPGYVAELRELVRARGGDVGLAEYLRETGCELADLYRGGRTWSELRRRAGLVVPPGGPAAEAAALGRALGRLLHVDDLPRLRGYVAGLAAPAPPVPKSEADRRRWAMLTAVLFARTASADAGADLARLWAHPDVRAELRELLALVADGVDHEARPWSAPHDAPLLVHARYHRDEVMVALHVVGRDGRIQRPREGVWFHPASGCNLLFVTLEKTEKQYSPSTMYEDYAVSDRLFHWQSQSGTSADSEKGRRHVEHVARGVTPLLFVRERKKDERGETVPYRFLGPVHYRRHEGERPMSIWWALEFPIPPDALRRMKIAA